MVERSFWILLNVEKKGRENGGVRRVDHRQGIGGELGMELELQNMLRMSENRKPEEFKDWQMGWRTKAGDPLKCFSET